MAKERDYRDFIDVFDPMIEGIFDAADDIRHTWEQVIYGRPVTADIAQIKDRDAPDVTLGIDTYANVDNDISPQAQANHFYDMPDLSPEQEETLGLEMARRSNDRRELDRDIHPIDIDR